MIVPAVLVVRVVRFRFAPLHAKVSMPLSGF